MFEKKSEEYAIENWEYYEEGKNDSKALKQAYRQGAEFGYNKAMNEAKGIIKDLIHFLPKENIEGVYEVAEEAEQFLRLAEKSNTKNDVGMGR